MFDLARFLVDQFLELAHLVLGVNGGPAGALQRFQAVGPGLLEHAEPRADGFAVDREDVLHLADREAPTAEQDGMRPSAEGEISVVVVDGFELLFGFLGEFIDEF